MNLKDLFDQTPVARHSDIIVSNNHIYITDADGDVTEYVLLGNDELREVRNEKRFADKLKSLKTDTEAIKGKVGA